jgi:ElaB/YqjD/DUF883 family membrane-anchored ribosome-binding protein
MARRSARATIDRLAAQLAAAPDGPEPDGPGEEEAGRREARQSFATLRAELEALAAELEDRGSGIIDDVEAAVRERPLAALALALGLGLVLGLALGRR